MVMVHLRGRRECGSFERLVFICDIHEGGINQMSSLYGGRKGNEIQISRKNQGGRKSHFDRGLLGVGQSRVSVGGMLILDQHF